MWVLLGVTVLLLVSMVIVVLRLLDQSETHVATIKRTKIKLNNAQFRAEVSEADEVIQRDVEKDRFRTKAVYAHWELSRGAMKLISTMENLTTLDLSDATLKDSWLRYLEKLPLENLDLQGTSVSDEGAAHLAKILTLKKLSIYDTNVSGKAIEILEPLKNLTQLYINGTKTTDEDIKALVNFPHLEGLNLAGTLVTDAGCETVAKLDKVYMLEMSHLSLTNKGLEYLSTMKSLGHLRVRGCGIDDAQVPILAKYPHLKDLDLTENPIHDKGLEALSKFPNLESLCVVDCNNLTKAGVEKFKKARPTVRFSVDKRVVAI